MSAPPPVHGELSDQRDVGVVGAGLVLVVQEVEVGAVHGEALAPELVARVVLVQLRQRLLELGRETQTHIYFDCCSVFYIHI